MDGRPDLERLRVRPLRDIVRSGDGLVVSLTGELDLHDAPAIRDALLASSAEDPLRLVVDLSDVAFVDSTVLGVFLEARSRLPAGVFALAAPGREIRRALEVSGLDREFAIHESVDAALAARL